MRIGFTLFIALVSLSSIAQVGKPEEIVEEGKALYRSELASWHGTDIFLESFPEQRKNIGGYFSYGDSLITHCIFFAKDDNTVLATISFDSKFPSSSPKLDSTKRGFSDYEKQIHSLRKTALEIVNDPEDKMFHLYKNTSLNLIPMIKEKTNLVYILTGTTENDLVIFGNDYLLEFDKENKLLSKKMLHRNIIPVRFNRADTTAFASVHSHSEETGDYITATDICTLMLYGRFTGWKQHIVISANYVSIWNLVGQTLITMPRDIWENENKPGNNGKKKKKD